MSTFANGDPTKIPQPRHLKEAEHNLTIAVESQSLTPLDRKTVQKPYVATQVDTALKEKGVNLDLVASKILEQMMATTTVLEPVLEPLVDEDGNQMYDESEGKLIPLMRPKMEQQGSKFVIVQKAVQKPDYKTNQFALSFYERVLIATKETTNEGSYKDGVQGALAIAEFMKNNKDIVQAIQKNQHSGNPIADEFFAEYEDVT